MDSSTPAGPRGLARLANELLDNIFSHLGTFELHKLSLMCRHTNAAANNALYQHYANHNRKSGETTLDIKPLYPFLRTLCERPDLALNVKSLNAIGWETEGDVARKLNPQMKFSLLEVLSSTQETVEEWECRDSVFDILDPQEVASFPTFLHAATNARLIPEQIWKSAYGAPQISRDLKEMQNVEDFVRNLRNGVEDAYLVLIFGLLPNLEHLECRRLRPFPILDWYTFLRESPAALRKLRYIKLHGVAGCNSSLHVLGMLPNLTSLHIKEIATSRLQTLERLPTTQLTSIILSGSSIPYRFFEIIANGQAIQKIHYSAYGRPRLACIWSQLPTIPPSSNNSLRCLTFNAPSADHWSLLSDAFGLLQLRNLDYLQTTVSSLCQPIQPDDVALLEPVLRRRIPPSLRTLVIRRAQVRCLAVLELIAQLRQSSVFPNLTAVRVYFYPTTDLSKSSEADLLKVFEEAGIALTIQFTEA